MQERTRAKCGASISGACHGETGVPLPMPHGCLGSPNANVNTVTVRIIMVNCGRTTQSTLRTRGLIEHFRMRDPPAVEYFFMTEFSSILNT